eukprot:SAG11_NODE_27270_length_334_cov_1.800000_1_plen_68_part_10
MRYKPITAILRKITRTKLLKSGKNLKLTNGRPKKTYYPFCARSLAIRIGNGGLVPGRPAPHQRRGEPG